MTLLAWLVTTYVLISVAFLVAMIHFYRLMNSIKRALEQIRQQVEQDPIASGLTRRMLELQQGRFLQSHRVRDPRVTEGDMK